ncbi:MAG: type II secretion system minor pseudopilin GspK [Nitrospirae bacterium]|nr:type II secretion system minor pseudopilin GspK [Nitrospirota bacterium]
MKYAIRERTGCRSGSRSKGSALVIVLLLVAIITALVVEFAYEIYVDTASVANWIDAQRASLTAKSGQAFSSEFLKRVKGYDYTYTRQLTVPVPMDFGPDNHLVLKAEDENARININKIVHEETGELTPSYDMLIRLLKYLNIDISVAASIADWIDHNSEPRSGNSEEGAKNSPFWSVDELKLVEGMNEDAYNKLIPYVTVYGETLNVNTAELPVLMSLSDSMTETICQKIIERRSSSPFESKAEFLGMGELQGVNITNSTILAAKSNYFRISSIATSHDITRVIESVIDTSLKVHYWREG